MVLIDGELDVEESIFLLKTLREYSLFDECGFILISGHAQESVRQTALAAGANFFLLKPVDFEQLEKFLRNYFSNKQQIGYR